ncbi:zinc dependent phospholipase C family protein [Hymenobacter canadensis]|uniref:Zinc dependent phospholipase C family protein n=1 Tax=Hymenobacter canadensis TaxID=2999067 RepID=A0ABY7LNU5_9BACT|nr:zinc dependent phospholipase C family protein [Hymenobacter canadensis]WBA42092.1 zinc dependent phospholipase C family protein [Hymenobacter canadensis]
MKKQFLLLLCLVLLVPVTSPGWGFFAHRTIAQISVYALPASMQAFYFRHMKEIVRLSTSPDERRDSDPTEASKHFIDLDHFGDNPFGAMPKAWEKAEAKYTADTLRKYGTVPWTIIDVKDQLTTAFKQRDTVAIVRLSAELCHYVADAYVPLHTTENYDGQLTNQAGMHSLWESKLPERHIAEYKLDSESAKYVKEPLNDVWKVLQESYGFLGETFDREEKVTRQFTPETKYSFSHKFGKTRRFYSDAFADAYHKEVGGMVAFRLKLAPTFISSLWLTAWKDGGSPNLNELMGRKPDKADKDSLDAQLKIWKDNGLVPQQMLLAMQKQAVVVQADQINAAKDMAPPMLETTSPPVAPAPAAAPKAATAATPTPAPAPAGKGPEKVKTKTKSADGGSTKTKEKEPNRKKKAAQKDDGWGAPAGSGW